jgi:ferredoxin
MKVKVDYEECDGHGVCVDTCPEVFALGDDDEEVTLLTDTPDEALREQVERAVMLCPKAAISVE